MRDDTLIYIVLALGFFALYAFVITSIYGY